MSFLQMLLYMLILLRNIFSAYYQSLDFYIKSTDWCLYDLKAEIQNYYYYTDNDAFKNCASSVSRLRKF